jgi:hypothetical protein
MGDEQWNQHGNNGGMMGDLIHLQKRVGKQLWEMTDDELIAFLLEDEEA